MCQLSLFDQSVIARPSDPITSHVAAASVQPKLSGRRAEFVDCLRRIGRPATAQEIAALADVRIRESVRKRAKECVNLGYVVEVGTKRCDVTGENVTAYWVAK
jgi:hypothetical protein